MWAAAPQPHKRLRAFLVVGALVHPWGNVAAWPPTILERLRLLGHIIYGELCVRRSEEYQAFLDHYPVLGPPFGRLSWLEHGFTEALRLPAFLDRLDWYLFEPILPEGSPSEWRWLSQLPHRRAADPRTVLASASRLGEVLQAVGRLDASHSGRALLIYDDVPLSEALVRVAGGSDDATKQRRAAAAVRILRHFFRQVYYVNKDVEIDGVSAFPLGLNEHYNRNGVAEAAVEAIAAAAVDDASKPLGVLAAWGAKYKVGTLSPGGRSQQQAGAWALTAEARAVGVEVRSIEPHTYWAELAKYRFMLSPFSNGYQRHGMYEALLVLTVPIVPWVQAYSNLLSLGFPIVVVAHWEEATSRAPRTASLWHTHTWRTGIRRGDWAAAGQPVGSPGGAAGALSSAVPHR